MPTTTGRLRNVAVTLPIGTRLRTELASLLRPVGDQLVELPGTVGGLPGSPPTTFLPVAPTVVVELEAHQGVPEFGQLRHRPRVERLRLDLAPQDVQPFEGP